MIEFPSLLLPPGVSSGSVVNIRVNRNQPEEKRQRDEFAQLQEEILDTFGRESPLRECLTGNQIKGLIFKGCLQARRRRRRIKLERTSSWDASLEGPKAA